MATQTAALQSRNPGRDTFYVVRQGCSASLAGTVTVLHHVPTGAAELASFANPNQAIDFAEALVRELGGIGSDVELVDPPYGLVGTG